jgi:hypothetical protein
MRPRSVIPFLTRGNPSRQDTERPQTVLQVGRDNELLRLRAKIIGSAGYVVRSMTPDQTLAEMREAFAPRVWVLCHTLDFYELALLAVAIRSQCPADRLLRLTGLNDDLGQAPGLFHDLLEPITSVDDLLRVVAALAQRPPARKTV